MKNIACKNKIVSMVPSIITLLNACSGFIGILLVIVGYAHHQLSYINMAFYSIFFSILIVFMLVNYNKITKNIKNCQFFSPQHLITPL